MIQTEPTVVIGYAGGYASYRLVISKGTLPRLERAEVNPETNAHEKWIELEEFNTPAEAWAFVGRCLGWVPCTHDRDGDGDCQYCHRVGVCYQRNVTR